MFKKTRIVHATCGVALFNMIGIALSGAAHAQQGAATQTGSGLEEIIVQATRRSTDLQSTPVAVTALTAREIQSTAPQNIGDVAAFVPNFNASRITGFNAASFAMRGVGQNNIIVYFEAPVAVLVDDFVMPSVQTQLLDTFDIAQIEVLRGPQGTLFGKNTTGGAVTVRTKRPEIGETSGEIGAQFGDFGTRRVQGAVNFSPSDTLAVRIVAANEESDGYMENGSDWGPVTGFAPNKWQGLAGRGDGDDVGGTDVFNGRLKVLFQPNEQFDALLQGEIVRDKSDSPAAVNETSTGGGFFLFNALGLGGGTGDPLDRAGVSNRNDVLLDFDEGHKIDVDGVYLNMNYRMDAGTLTSVSGFRKQKSRLPSTYTGEVPVAADGEILSLFDASRDDDRETWQQEIRFASTSSGPFNYVLGGFYQRDKVDFCVNQLLGFLDLASGGLPFGSWNQNPYILCNDQSGTSKALFGEGTYQITDSLTLTAGLRYTWEKKTWHGRQQTFVQALGGGFDPAFTWRQLGSTLEAGNFDRFPAGVVKLSEDWHDPSWRISLSNQFSDDLMGYITYARGFKGGAFNDQIGGFAAFGTDLNAFREASAPTDPEQADSYEIGLKSEFFDNRVRFNLTGFYVEYTDVQKQIVVPIVVNNAPNQVTRFFNAAEMEVMGAEVELTVLPIDRLTLRAIVGYQDGEYKDYTTPIPAGYDLTDAPIDRAPEWQFTLDGSYEIPLGAWNLVLNANMMYTDSSLFTQSIDSAADNTFLDEKTLINANITLRSEDERYYVRLIGRNLGDQRYRTASQTVGGLWTFTLYGPPRFFGIEGGIRFGS
jgi:iron complex outermembrane recepter protein